jgi:hypothetical protein
MRSIGRYRTDNREPARVRHGIAGEKERLSIRGEGACHVCIDEEGAPLPGFSLRELFGKDAAFAREDRGQRLADCAKDLPYLQRGGAENTRLSAAIRDLTSATVRPDPACRSQVSCARSGFQETCIRVACDDAESERSCADRMTR